MSGALGTDVPIEGSGLNEHGRIGRLASGTAIALTSGLAGRVLKFGFHVVVSRVFGVQGYAAYVLGFNIVAVLQNFSTCALDQALVRYLPAYRAGNKASAAVGLLRLTFVLCTSVSVLFGVAIFAASSFLAVYVFHAPFMAPVVRIFAGALLFFTWLAVGIGASQGFQAVKQSVLIQDVLFPASALLILIGLIPFRFGLLSAPLAFLGATTVAGASVIFLIMRRVRREFRIKPVYLAHEWVRFSVQVTAIGGSALVFTSLSAVALGVFGNVSEVGIYSAAMSLVLQSGILFTGMAVVLPAMLSELFSRGEVDEAGRLLRTAARWLAILAQPFFLVLIALAAPLLGLFGPSFTRGVPSLIVLAAGIYVSTITVFNGYALVASGRQKVDMVDHLGILLLAAVAYPIAAHFYGMFGVAAVTGALHIIISVAKAVQVRTILRTKAWDARLFAVVAGGFLTGLCYFAPVQLGLMASVVVRDAWLAVCVSCYFAVILTHLDVTDYGLLGVMRRRLSVDAGTAK